jgi:hypothetical protein
VALVYGEVSVPAPEQARAAAPAAARGARPNPAAGGPSGGPASGPLVGLLQLKSPSLDVSGNVDLDQLRQQLLRSNVIAAPIANQLLAIADWKTTVPFPITKGQAREVPVDGVTGTLVVNEFPMPVLFWQKDGVFYVMSGTISEAQLLEAARSFAPVR